MTEREHTGMHLTLSLYYNMDNNPLPECPELGPNPHAQKVMQALGISYLKSVPHSVTDNWMFYHCDNIPEVMPSWLRKVGNISDHWADVLGLPREGADQ